PAGVSFRRLPNLRRSQQSHVCPKSASKKLGDAHTSFGGCANRLLPITLVTAALVRHGGLIMKSKTAAAIAASMMALCLPAKAVTVDAATPVEIFFTIPPGLLPTVLCCGVSDATLTLNFNAADPLGSFDVMTLQWFDANHTLLDATQPAHKGDVTTISVDSFF